MVSRCRGSRISIVHVFPTVLGLYGDRGNALAWADGESTTGQGFE